MAHLTDKQLDVKDFMSRVVESYNHGTAEMELEANAEVARSIIPAATGAFRDFSYIAPEILKNEGFQGGAADIWSAGIVLYAMVQGRVPFFSKDVQELYMMITKNQYSPLQKCSPDLEDLIKRTLEKDPKKRITGEQILNHPWMKNSNYNNMAKSKFIK